MLHTFAYLLMTLLMIAGIFLIGLVLLQRGRGGGLAGAFGGMGGQSAFGTKAGDVFTRITIVVAAVWILLCAGGVVTLRSAATGLRTDDTLFKKENAVENKKANPKSETEMEDQVPLGPGGPVAPANNPAPENKPDNAPAEPAKPEDKPAAPQNEPKPEEKKAEEKPKAEEPAPANPDNKPAEEKPAEPPK